MSRFGAYLTSQQLAKHWLIVADEREKEGDLRGAIQFLIRAVREFQTCTNNLASMQFEPRKRKRGQP